MLVGLLVTVHEASVEKNPLPDNVPEVPAGPELGVIVTVGPITVKVAVAKSLTTLPVSFTVYTPAGVVPLTVMCMGDSPVH